MTSGAPHDPTPKSFVSLPRDLIGECVSHYTVEPFSHCHRQMVQRHVALVTQP